MAYNNDELKKNLKKQLGLLYKDSQWPGFDIIIKKYFAMGKDDDRHLAYILATTLHETAFTMKPITEYGSQAYLKAKAYWPYVGRGYVQLTWKGNYEKYGIAATPERALEPDFAAYILIDGMSRGIFTGKALDDYISGSKEDPMNARRIVNGTDKAADIANYYHKILAALRASVGVSAPEPTPVTPVIEIPKETETPGWFEPFKIALLKIFEFLFGKKPEVPSQPVVTTPQEPKEEPKKTKTPWFWELKKHEGKVETDSAFQTMMNRFWGLSGLPAFKGLVGSARAWCGLFLFMGMYLAGYATPKNAFRAKSWDDFGQKIEWRKNGFVQGSVVRINSAGNCSSTSDNHVTMANGDCSPEDLNKAGATFSGYGGNQGNQAKVSTYSVATICSVTFPKEIPLPPRVTKSVNCSNGKTSGESTR